MNRNVVLSLLAVLCCSFITAGCDEPKVEKSQNEKLDEWIRKGGVKGPMQRPWEEQGQASKGNEEKRQ